MMNKTDAASSKRARRTTRLGNGADQRRRTWLRAWLVSSVAALLLWLPSVAVAGEIKLSSQPLDVDENGRLTAESAQRTTTKLSSEPGRELWSANLWAALDKGAAPGPIYVEFATKLESGALNVALVHEEADFDGARFVTMSVDLDGNRGFNKGRTYDVKVFQVEASGKRLVLAEGRVTLEYTEQTEDRGMSDEQDAADMSDQDEFDSLVGDGGEEAQVGDDVEPPPVAPTKKGCAVGTRGGLASMLLLGLFGVSSLRRRAHRVHRVRSIRRSAV